MKNLIAKLSREPALVLGVVTAALSLAVLFGVPITSDQMAGIGIFIGAVFALTRYLTTPTSEVIAQKMPDNTIVAGGVVEQMKGQMVEVSMDLSFPPGDMEVDASKRAHP